MDRLATRKDALNRQEAYVYDSAGNLTQFTDRKNQVTTFTYDALNRRIGASYADGSSTSFIYDSVGRLTRATDSLVGAIEFVYDNLDRLSKEISAQGVVEYTYDALGRRATMKANGATPVSYGYDAASRLIQVAQAGLVVGLSYDAAGRRTGLTYPNGTNTSYSYGNASRLTAITHNGPSGLIESLSYVYDAAGNRISLARTNGTASNLPAAVQAAYDVANEQITFNSLPAIFDANGNQTTSADATGTTTYSWDARNRMVAQTGPGVTATFQYDALGRRVSVTINGQTRQMLYDGNDIVAEIGGGAVSATYLRSLNIDEPFIRQTATGNEFYHVDALGSTLDLTNQTGAVQTSYHYEAFGKTTITGTSSNLFQYTGRENDGAGLYYYRARYYRSESHRFMREDPVEFNGGEKSLYVYVRDNPINAGDPYGLKARVCCRLLDNRFFGDFIGGKHCYIEVDGGQLGGGYTYGLYPNNEGRGIPQRGDRRPGALYNPNRDIGGDCKDCPEQKCQNQKACFANAHQNYPQGRYNWILGANSNTYAATLANKCCGGGFPSGFGATPAWGADPPYPRPPID